MFDIIGDVHGCFVELCTLTARLGYMCPKGEPVSHPDGRKIVFVGDLTDRGPDNMNVLGHVMKMVKSGNALCVMGNHDNKLMRWLKGNKVTLSNGLQKTVDELEKYATPEFRQEALAFIQNLPYRLVLDNGRLIVVHAALPERLHDKDNKKSRSVSMYGVTTGKTDANGYPERIDWAANYSGKPYVVHGHVAQKEATIKNRVINVDTACVYGNKLTALRYPEMEFRHADANDVYRYSKSLTPDTWLPWDDGAL